MDIHENVLVWNEYFGFIFHFLWFKSRGTWIRKIKLKSSYKKLSRDRQDLSRGGGSRGSEDIPRFRNLKYVHFWRAIYGILSLFSMLREDFFRCISMKEYTESKSQFCKNFKTKFFLISGKDLPMALYNRRIWKHWLPHEVRKGPLQPTIRNSGYGPDRISRNF